MKRLREELNNEDGLRSLCTRAKLDREALEQSGDLAEHQAEGERTRHELQAAMRAWIVKKLAQGLIERTLKEYERTRVPEVLRCASETFQLITGGRYERIQNTDARSFRVFTADEQVVDATLLSRGTQEQLYLSVRLGLTESFASQSGPLPLVMDDVLVNADPERANELACALVRAAQQHQVLFLTCHPHTVALLKKHVPDCFHLSLQRLKSTGAGTYRPTFSGCCDACCQR